ncbi:hypothetical protein Tco_1317145 [Tanacetum coccineum]
MKASISSSNGGSTNFWPGRFGTCERKQCVGNYVFLTPHSTASIIEAIKSSFGGNDESKKMQKLAFVFENTSGTNDISTAYGVSTSTGHNLQCENNPSSYSFLANQSSYPQLDHEDLE